jgi:uncharacterized membrane protein YagU involved in acid resistance
LQVKTKKMRFFLMIGFFAGLIWGGVKLIEYGLKFTELTPGILIEPFFKHTFVISWWGLGIGWVAFIVFSIIAALIYGFALRKVKGPLLGMVYGVVWWTVIYWIIGPWVAWVPKPRMLNWNTIISDFCLFLLWGLFIGYSIAMEFTDEESREPQKQK